MRDLQLLSLQNSGFLATVTRLEVSRHSLSVNSHARESRNIETKIPNPLS